MISFNSYSKIYSLGHRATRDLLAGPVLCEEKVDGSQFSFGVDELGDLHVRSKGAIMIPDAPEKMFAKGVEFIKSIQDKLVPGWTYRGEYLAKPKHNVLAYDRVPNGHIILFDIAKGLEDYLPYEAKAEEAARLGMEIVPRLFSGVITLEQFRDLLQTTSVLGGQKIEGVVVKPLGYDVFDQDKKVLMGKFVSEDFKEKHAGEWKAANPGTLDVVAIIGGKLCHPGRWSKAVQHLTEAGQLTNTPKDIGMLMKEVQKDVLDEETEAIKQALFDYAWGKISRQVVMGLPEWYKEQLLKSAFETEEVLNTGL